MYGLLGLNIIMANKKEDVKEMKLLFKEMFHCMRVISQNESPECQKFFDCVDQMNSFGQLMAQCLQTVATNKEHQLAVIEEKHRNVQIDEEDEGEIKQELYKITGAATYINECCDIIMQTYKGDAADMIDNAVRAYFGKVLQDYKSVSERELQDATFFFMEYIEHCRNSDKMMIYELCSQFAEITLWTQPEMMDVRQNTIYGIGVMAKHLNQAAFKSLVGPAMKSVEHVLSNPTATSEEQLAVTENTYVTLARLSLLHTLEASHINQFLSALPLKGDDEAQEAHEFLFEQVLANNSVLMGPCKETMQ